MLLPKNGIWLFLCTQHRVYNCFVGLPSFALHGDQYYKLEELHEILEQPGNSRHVSLDIFT